MGKVGKAIVIALVVIMVLVLIGGVVAAIGWVKGVPDLGLGEDMKAFWQDFGERFKALFKSAPKAAFPAPERAAPNVPDWGKSVDGSLSSMDSMPANGVLNYTDIFQGGTSGQYPGQTGSNFQVHVVYLIGKDGYFRHDGQVMWFSELELLDPEEYNKAHLEDSGIVVDKVTFAEELLAQLFPGEKIEFPFGSKPADIDALFRPAVRLDYNVGDDGSASLLFKIDRPVEGVE